MKKYIITATADKGYAAQVSKGYPVIRTTEHTTTWIHDDRCGYGFALDEVRRELNGYYREDAENGSEGYCHKYFEMSYESDRVTYRAEPADWYEVVDNKLNGWVHYSGFILGDATRILVEERTNGHSADLYKNGQRVWPPQPGSTATAEDIMNELND